MVSTFFSLLFLRELPIGTQAAGVLLSGDCDGGLYRTCVCGGFLANGVDSRQDKGRRRIVNRTVGDHHLSGVALIMKNLHRPPTSIRRCFRVEAKKIYSTSRPSPHLLFWKFPLNDRAQCVPAAPHPNNNYDHVCM